MAIETDPPAARPVPAHPTPPSAPLEALPLDYAMAKPASSFRWVILGLVFFAITINYIDRLVMGILAPDLMDPAKYNLFDKESYGYIQAAFAFTYAFGQMASGRWLDWIGTRIGYAIALTAWSASSMLHALARGPWSFGAMRGLLGVSESPAFPAAVKTLAEWFPKKERALAFGFVNAGSNVGAILAPLLVPWLALNFGWQMAFIATGAVGLVWLVLWLPFYRRPQEHPRVSPSELAYINSDPPEPTATKIRWASLLTHRQSWAFVLGKFLTDPMWWFYMTWIPTFFKDRHGLDLKTIGLPLIVVYLLADVGSIGGGWLSSTMMKRGYSLNHARKLALFLSALCVVPIVFASYVSNLWMAVVLLGMATAGHQGFSSNLYTLVSDMFPKRATGSVAGLGGTAGYLGATAFSAMTGLILQRWTNNNYLVLFAIAGTAYLLAFLAIHLLAPRLEPAVIESSAGGGFPVAPPTSNGSGSGPNGHA